MSKHKFKPGDWVIGKRGTHKNVLGKVVETFNLTFIFAPESEVPYEDFKLYHSVDKKKNIISLAQQNKELKAENEQLKYIAKEALRAGIRITQIKVADLIKELKENEN